MTSVQPSKQGSGGEATYTLTYDDGDVEADVYRLKVRVKGEKQRGKLEVGERVDALCHGLSLIHI